MEEAAPRLSFSNQSVWLHLLLQTAQNQPFIRHAITTIGALCRSSRNLGLMNDSTLGIQNLPHLFQGCTTPSDSKRSYQFALQQYDKFIAGAKEEISSDVRLYDNHMRRTAMIVCLLVVCIETLQFRYTVAMRHSQDGLRLLQDYLDTTPRREGQYGALPHPIEDELVLQFRRLDLQTLSWYGARTPVDHTKIKCEGVLKVRTMPEVFTNLGEGGSCLDIVMRRAYHFM